MQRNPLADHKHEGIHNKIYVFQLFITLRCSFRSAVCRQVLSVHAAQLASARLISKFCAA